VNDIYDRPLLIARVELPRTITQEANRTLAFYLLVISLVTFGALAVAIYMIHQITLRDRTIQLKNDFFSIASHELRTPLSVIRGNSSLILQIFGPKSEPKLSEIAQSIYDSSVRLNKIVSNFLDAARLEGGQLPLSIQPIGLEPPVSPVIKELRTLAEQKGLYVRLELPVGLPQVMVDPVRVQQVVYNLVGNALKFTEKGGVTVKAEVDVGKVVVSVTDTGRGMSESQQRMLFKRFQQIQKTDMTNGTGLGLYISKMLVEKMGGRIWLSASEEGKGSVICFSVPIATSG
jgi:signal transduction histidine kinase